MILNKLFEFFFFYVPYRAYKYYSTSPTPKISAFILLLFLLSSHVFSFFIIFNEINELDYSLFSEDKVKNRFVTIPLMLLPFTLFMLLFYILNRETLKNKAIAFEAYSDKDQKRYGLYYWCYVVGSILFFLSALVSPLWVKALHE